MKGVLVGGDEAQEWMLSWWWDHFIRHNDYPVMFVDFGLSPKAQTWCRERGTLLNLRSFLLCLKRQGEIQAEWGALVWDSREAWFKKPTACLSSPYDTTLWLDLDCQVVGSLEPLFEMGALHGFAMAKDCIASQRTPYPVYNSGVIAFQKGHPLLTLWEKDAQEKNQLFRGDQDVLAHTIQESQIPVHEMPPSYNWSPWQGNREDVVIYHWWGNTMKSILRGRIDGT
jgi:hypothetical protein